MWLVFPERKIISKLIVSIEDVIHQPVTVMKPQTVYVLTCLLGIVNLFTLFA